MWMGIPRYAQGYHKRNQRMELEAQIKDLVDEALRGEAYAIASNGYRSNGFRITIKALETINQLIMAQGVKEVNPDALVWWDEGQEHSLNKSVADLRSMGTPFAQHVWKLLVTWIYHEKDSVPVVRLPSVD